MFNKGFQTFNRIFWALCSLKSAVLIIFGIAVSLAAGTIIESLYDTPTAQYWVYRAGWFYGLLVLFGLNIFAVAMSRLPWRTRHIPFLLAHLGILILLWGSFLTQRVGVDGNLRITEGESTSVVELDQAALVISDRDRVWSLPIQWLPPEVNFKPFQVSSQGVPLNLKVDQFLSHADSTISFIPDPEVETAGVPHHPTSAVRMRLVGGAMGISQEYWLWEGSPQWSDLQAGPSRLFLGPQVPAAPSGQAPRKQPVLAFQPGKDGSLSYWAQSSAGKQVKGKWKRGQIVGQKLNPGWKGNVLIEILDWIPKAMPLTSYKPARVQYGQLAPSAAIHVVAGETGKGTGTDVWLGLGDRAVVHLEDRNVDIGYFPKRVILPFSVRLERFIVEHDQGTLNPAAYASRVITTADQGQKESLISMNEPLELKGYTLYQASYEDADPRPVTSILSVNQDPGRFLKYLGSLLIVLGSILLFAAKYKRKKVASPLGHLTEGQPISVTSEA